MSSTKIVLTSSDGETFEIEEAVARQLQIIAHMMEDDCADKAIPLRNVTGTILAKVIEYCKAHVGDAEDEEAEKKLVAEADSTEAEDDKAKKKLEAEADSTETEDVEAKKKWDAEFMKNLDLNTTFKLILAANYLNVKGLLDLTSQAVADHIKDKTVEEVREIFNVENDYSTDEEEAVRKDNEWAFD